MNLDDCEKQNYWSRVGGHAFEGAKENGICVWVQIKELGGA